MLAAGFLLCGRAVVGGASESKAIWAEGAFFGQGCAVEGERSGVVGGVNLDVGTIQKMWQKV
jgi:hypothetical protein